MNVYLFIAQHKKSLEVYLPYFKMIASSSRLVKELKDADVVLILGAWSWDGAKTARRARKMGIPYVVCPLGDLSERNRHNPGLRRSLQTMFYQRKMMAEASLLLATSPMEQGYLTKTTRHKRIILLRYFAYSHLTTRDHMATQLSACQEQILADFERTKAEAIAAKTKSEIVRQLLQIESRMPHENIPLSYLNSLHTLLYADNYDEDALCSELQRLKLTDFAAAVFEAMSEKTGLTEGFMPLPPKKSGKSKEIVSYIST